MPKMVCVTCKREFVPDKTGVPAVQLATFGPYKLHEADRWRCPVCGFKVVAGFSDDWHEHFEPSFARELNRAQARPGYIEYAAEDLAALAAAEARHKDYSPEEDPRL